MHETMASQPSELARILADPAPVEAAVNRIRNGFLGLTASTPPPLSAEVLLTPMEAFRGVKVPLAVPVRGTCRVCGGRGESWMEICSSCSGRGDALMNHQVQISVPPRVRHGARFRFSVVSPSTPATHVEVRISIQ